MSEFLGVLRWITINIFGEASILIGLIVLLGLVLQKKSLADIVSGTLKGILGFLIIGAGAGIIVSALLIFQPIWTEVFGLSSMNLTNIIVPGALQRTLRKQRDHRHCRRIRHQFAAGPADAL
ncbi:PTS transporter subunit IIC [Klebsiella michiganensis]|nr:PTS transporter subunit IIC [Klebsiella michiganensis]